MKPKRTKKSIVVDVTEADTADEPQESPYACPITNAVGFPLREMNPNTGEYVEASRQRISILRYGAGARRDYWTSQELAEWMRAYDRGIQVPPITIELQGDDARIAPGQENER